MTLRLVSGALGALGLIFVLSAGSARADCNPDSALYADDFEGFMDANWGEADENLFVEDGALVAKSYTGVVNFATTGTDINACVDVTFTKAPDPNYTYAGMVFWWTDWDNYYYVFYWPAGTVNIWRVLKGKDTYLAEAHPANVKKGVGQTNRLELDLKGKTATFLVNGQVAIRLKGIPPKGGSPIGLVADAPKDKQATVKFDDFIVSETAAQE
jgi:hypothetical protein